MAGIINPFTPNINIMDNIAQLTETVNLSPDSYITHITKSGQNIYRVLIDGNNLLAYCNKNAWTARNLPEYTKGYLRNNTIGNDPRRDNRNKVQTNNPNNPPSVVYGKIYLVNVMENLRKQLQDLYPGNYLLLHVFLKRDSFAREHISYKHTIDGDVAQYGPIHNAGSITPEEFAGHVQSLEYVIVSNVTTTSANIHDLSERYSKPRSNHFHYIKSYDDTALLLHLLYIYYQDGNSSDNIILLTGDNFGDSRELIGDNSRLIEDGNYRPADVPTIPDINVRTYHMGNYLNGRFHFTPATHFTFGDEIATIVGYQKARAVAHGNFWRLFYTHGANRLQKRYHVSPVDREAGPNHAKYVYSTSLSTKDMCDYREHKPMDVKIEKFGAKMPDCPVFDPDRSENKQLIDSIAESNPANVNTALNNGASVNMHYGDTNGTPLHYAVGVGSNIAIVNSLLTNGAKTMSKDNNGDTPSHIAARTNDANSEAIIRQMILKGFSILTTNNAGQTVLDLAQDASRAKAYLQGLIDEGLLEASRANTLDEVKRFIRFGANPNYANGTGETPSTVTTNAAIRTFIEKQSKLKAPDSKVMTKVEYENMMTKAEYDKMIADHLIKLQEKDKELDQWDIDYEHQKFEYENLLINYDGLKQQANVLARQLKECNIDKAEIQERLRICLENPQPDSEEIKRLKEEIIRLTQNYDELRNTYNTLLKNCQDTENENENMLEQNEKLRDKLQQMNMTLRDMKQEIIDCNGKLESLEFDYNEVEKQLENAREQLVAKAEESARMYNTVVEYAHVAPHLLRFAVQSKDYTLATNLINRDVSVDVKDPETDRTALMHASEYGNIDVMTLLLDHGADINAIDQTGLSSLQYAVQPADNNAAVTLLCSREFSNDNLFKTILLAVELNRNDSMVTLAQVVRRKILDRIENGTLEEVKNLFIKTGLVSDFGTGPTFKEHATTHNKPEMVKYISTVLTLAQTNERKQAATAAAAAVNRTRTTEDAIVRNIPGLSINISDSLAKLEAMSPFSIGDMTPLSLGDMTPLSLGSLSPE
jgi:ankyrin repeat protein